MIYWWTDIFREEGGKKRVDGMVRAGGEGWAMVEGLERFLRTSGKILAMPLGLKRPKI